MRLANRLARYGMDVLQVSGQSFAAGAQTVVTPFTVGLLLHRHPAGQVCMKLHFLSIGPCQ